jgi:hypothetical protein
VRKILDTTGFRAVAGTNCSAAQVGTVCAINAIAMQAAVMYRVDYLRSIASSDAENEVSFLSNCYRADKRLVLARSAIGSPADEDLSLGSGIDEWCEDRQLFHHNAPQVFARQPQGRSSVMDGI